MRSRPDARRALLLSLWLAAGGATATAAAAPAGPPTRAQVQAAAQQVGADPDLPGVRTEKSLRFKASAPRSPAQRDADGGSFGWLHGFFQALTEGARVLVWGLGAAVLAWVALRARRWMRLRAGAGRHALGPLPSHVGALDIRPESLPADIGGAAAALWQRGQQRAALSLLYRGALSRLVHDEAVPVRAASTEGECVALAAPRLGADAQAFFVQLVGAWQSAAYGGRLPATAGVLALCDGFERQLPARQATAGTPGAAA